MAAVAASYKRIEGLKGNSSSIASFYEMECYRAIGVEAKLYRI